MKRWDKSRRPRTTPPRHALIVRGSPVPNYPPHILVRTITTGGTFRFGKRRLYVANALTNQRIGLEETDDGLWAVYFHTVLLGTFDERDDIIQG